MFFVTEDVKQGESLGAVMSRFGLDEPKQRETLLHKHNAHLRGGADVPQGSAPDFLMRMLLTMPVVQNTTIVIPIDIKLSVVEFQPVIDLKNGLRPRQIGVSGPPTLTHGVNVKIKHSLPASTGLNWIQTVKKLNNPDRSAPVEFVDVGHNNLPFFIQPPKDQAPPAMMDDTPVGPVAPRPGAGVDFTAMTTIAVLARGRIILAAGMVWSFVIGTANKLPEGIMVRQRPRDATDMDFRNQLRILKLGLNQYRAPTGANLDYVLPPTADSVVR
jgi:hypothetical protein